MERRSNLATDIGGHVEHRRLNLCPTVIELSESEQSAHRPATWWAGSRVLPAHLKQNPWTIPIGD